MPCDFTSFLTVCQSSQDNGQVIMKKSVCSGASFRVEKILPQAGLELRLARSVG